MDGVTVRPFQEIGWDNAIHYLLTANEITAQKAYRLGMVQEVTAKRASLDKVMAIARKEVNSKDKENNKGLCWGEKSMFLFRRGSTRKGRIKI